jgi:nicotinamide mononucleotide transporter
MEEIIWLLYLHLIHNPLEIIGVVIGLTYLYLSYKANKWLWLAGILMPIVYVWIFLDSKFYAAMGLNIYYFFACIYGWIRWTRGKTSESQLQITHTPKRYIVPLIVVSMAIFAFISFILIRFTDTPVAYGDSFAAALSVVGMWLLAQKYIEQWCVWLVVNVVSCGLFVWQELYYTAVLFAVYSVISVFGYYKWKRLMTRV